MGQIFVTGDTHLGIDISKLNSKNFPQGCHFTKDDYVIICGDCGLTWDKSRETQYWVIWISNKPWTTLCIDGNHENFDELYSIPCEKKFGGNVRRVSDSIFYLNRGEVFELCGKTFFTMGGADSIDKAWRTPGKSWWKEEMPNFEEMEYAMDTLEKKGWIVDFVLTHSAPSNILYQINPMFKRDYLSDFLYEVYKKLHYKEWYFGHYHVDADFDKHHCLYNDIVRIV